MFAPDRALRLLAIATAVGSAISVVWIVDTNVSISEHGGCPSIDGTSYCRMAVGGVGHQPFARRPLEPALVRMLQVGSLSGRFRLVSLIGVVLAVVCAAILARRLALGIGASGYRATWGSVIAGALVVMLPHGFHEAMFFPVLADNLAMGLGLAWLVLFNSESPRWQAIAVLGAAGAVGAREEWAVPLLAIVVLAGAFDLRPRPNLGFLGAGVIVALAVDLTRSSSGVDFSTHIWPVLARHVRSAPDLTTVITNYAFALGSTPALAGLMLTRRRELRNRGVAAIAGPLAVIAAFGSVVALAAGWDVSRFVFLAAPPAVIVGAAATAAVPGSELYAALLVVASVAWWHPWFVVDGTPSQWARLYAPQFVGLAAMRAQARDFLMVGGPPLLIAAVIARRERSYRAASVDAARPSEDLASRRRVQTERH